MASVSGKVIIITGASSGIGAATALAAAAKGAKLVLAARRVDKLKAVADQCVALGAKAIAVSCDVAKRDDVHQAVETAISSFGRLDVMIANAGYGFVAKVHEMDEARFDDMVNVNIKGTWYCMQEAAPIMLKQKAGHIIAVSSAAARRGLPLYGVYSMTKAAQLSLVEAMRVELRGTGVYVSSVHPITTTTEFFDTASTLSRVKTSGVGAAQTAELVGQKIVKLIEHPKPELWPSGPSRLGLSFATMFPRLADKGVAKTLPKRNRK